MGNIELVVFDLAGTTVKDNRDVHRVLQHALQLHGVSITLDEANVVMGIPKPVAIRALLELRPTHRTISDEWIDDIHKDFVSTMIDFYETDTAVSAKAGVDELFHLLKTNGIKVAVDTGFDRAITAPLLKRLGWLERNLVDVSVTSDEVQRGRPFPDMIFHAMKLLQVTDASKVAKVGDTASDLEEGNAAGCGLVVGVTDGAFTREALTLSRHTHVIDSIAEIASILRLR